MFGELLITTIRLKWKSRISQIHQGLLHALNNTWKMTIMAAWERNFKPK